ncbi:hemagglutinin [Histophilus somni]|uniref:YadA-like family protein n=2 Tax=Histophilus somni TaxID=731 RepID=A0A9Q6YZ53_HISSO|nr:YadA-like family protein [Histophilus somni]ARU64985.1 hemagglutinin [Histophilus somni]ARU66851.1 hemagglutinin [Histophilus somni]ARU68722.1 hemagglutinin [Histophilus somni]ARU70604.1 hemagglutinin [Histophilus somni]ARU72477.1 hemagglutinin [Histophilus somni]
MKKCYFSLSLGAVLVLAANLAVAQNSSLDIIKYEKEGIYIGKSITEVPKNIPNAKAVAVGDRTKVGESAVAVGYEADAQKEGATAVGRGTKAQSYAVAMGHKAEAGVQAISIGKDAKGTGTLSVALGDEAKATHNHTLAFGRRASASGDSSHAFGYGATATGTYSNAFGVNAKASAVRSQAIGTDSLASGEGSISFGSGVHTTGKNSFSVGRQITNNSKNTVAIGYNIQHTKDNSVFLGDSSAYTAPSETSGGIGKVDGNYAGVEAKGVVSVGSKGNERRIQNVAAGLLSHHSTDAVNGSQLHATNQRVEEVNKDAKAGIAAAMAFKEVPFVPGKWSYAAGAAHYSSESAVSLNLGRTSANGKYSISGGISSDSRGRVGFRVGISGVFN